MCLYVNITEPQILCVFIIYSMIKELGQLVLAGGDEIFKSKWNSRNNENNNYSMKILWHYWSEKSILAFLIRKKTYLGGTLWSFDNTSRTYLYSKKVHQHERSFRRVQPSIQVYPLIFILVIECASLTGLRTHITEKTGFLSLSFYLLPGILTKHKIRAQLFWFRVLSHSW